MEKKLLPAFITIGELKVPYYMRHSNRAKRLQLAVRERRIELIIPKRTSPDLIDKFLHASKLWIKRQHLNLSNNLVSFFPKNIVVGEKITIEGKAYELNVKYASKGQVSILGDSITITVPLSTTIKELTATSSSILIKYLKELAQSRVEDYMEDYCQQLKRWPKRIKVKTQTSRWGSCGIHNDIYINWLLIMAPEFIAKYVVLHECCHLFYKNHGIRFWAKVSKIMPDFQKAEDWLNKYGRFLTVS